jgi:gliding motility-associated lipoprotein GldD
MLRFLLMKKLNFFFPLAINLSVFVIMACTDSSNMPKPEGYFRIDLPEHKFQQFDSTFPYAFDYSTHARLVFDDHPQSEPYWLNIHYPDFNATLHLSYKDLGKFSLYNLKEDARNFVFRHAPKAQGIQESVVTLPHIDVYGMVYFIRGKDAASPFQFYVTDSTSHFIRGALYFNLTPNNDSLKPVIDFIVDDIDHTLSSIRWKN